MGKYHNRQLVYFYILLHSLKDFFVRVNGNFDICYKPSI
jgi:hypothetical protein